MCYSSWSPFPGLTVAEAEHVIAGVRSNNGSQAVNESHPISIVEDMKQSAVEHRAELLAKLGQPQGVPHQESHFKTTISGLCLGTLDGSGSDVHTDGLLTESGGEQGVLTGAASHVENFAGETS